MGMECTFVLTCDGCSKEFDLSGDSAATLEYVAIVKRNWAKDGCDHYFCPDCHTLPKD